MSDLPEAADKTPADGKVTGFGAIDGRTVFVSADDVTVPAGAGGRVGVGKQLRGFRYAAEGLPVHLPRRRRRRARARHHGPGACQKATAFICLCDSFDIMSGGNMGSDVLLAWPNAEVSFMAPAVAVNVVYGRKLAAARPVGGGGSELHRPGSRPRGPGRTQPPAPRQLAAHGLRRQKIGNFP